MKKATAKAVFKTRSSMTATLSRHNGSDTRQAMAKQPKKNQKQSPKAPTKVPAKATKTKVKVPAKPKNPVDVLKQRLLDRLNQLMDTSLSDIQAPASQGDAADIAFAVDSASVSATLHARNSDEVSAIKEALHRIESGTYGTCAFCDNKIAPARLEALPYTNSCIGCQAANERNGHEPDNKRAWRVSEDDQGDAPAAIVPVH